MPEDGQDRGSGFFVPALVQSVDHDDRRDRGFHEGLDYQVFHLIIQRLVNDFRIRLDEPDEGRSKLGVPPGELDSQGGENRLEVPPVLEVSGAKEGSTKPSICKRPLSDRLGDGTLPRPSETVQPVDGGLVEVADPKFDIVQDGRACSSKATTAVAMSILGTFCIPDVIENSGFSCRMIFSDNYHWKLAKRRMML